MSAARIAFLALLLAALPLHARTKAPAAPAAASASVVFLSDIHFDPYADPAKVPQLIAAPASQWSQILNTPDSPRRSEEFTALQKSCNEAGIDADARVFQSSLSALRAQARLARLAIYTGDFLAHAFECKYRKLAPGSTPEQYLQFTVKTIEFVTSGLRSALPAVPLLFVLGNNDSGCADYSLKADSDPFFAALAPLLTSSLPAELRASVAADFAAGGHYSVLLPPPFIRTRVIAMDDLYFSSRYTGCGSPPDPTVAGKQLEWLNDHLSQARARQERVWFVGHIPPGVNLYNSARKLMASCSAASVTPFLSSDSLPTALAENSDLIPLALFGHTHFDEFHLLSPEELVPAGAAAPHARTQGIPVKIIPPVSPINGDPAFIVGQVRLSTATLTDYTLIVASNKTGVGTAWKPEYTYSARYRRRAFDSASVASLIAQLHADRTLATPASQAYISSVSAGVPTPLLQLAWAPYTCTMSNATTAGFLACACPGQ